MPWPPFSIQHGAVEFHLTESQTVPCLQYLVLTHNAVGMICIAGRHIDGKLTDHQRPLLRRQALQNCGAARECRRGYTEFGVSVALDTPDQTVGCYLPGARLAVGKRLH